MTVEFNTGFVAQGPLTVGFETQAANLKFGVNVQGTDVGVFGDGGAGFNDPEEGPPAQESLGSEIVLEYLEMEIAISETMVSKRLLGYSGNPIMVALA